MISNENCVRPLTIFQSVSTLRVIELKPAALDCQSEMSSFLSKPLRYLFITQLKQNRSLQAKTVFPKIPINYVDPFMAEGRGVLASKNFPLSRLSCAYCQQQPTLGAGKRLPASHKFRFDSDWLKLYLSFVIGSFCLRDYSWSMR